MLSRTANGDPTSRQKRRLPSLRSWPPPRYPLCPRTAVQAPGASQQGLRLTPMTTPFTPHAFLVSESPGRDDPDDAVPHVSNRLAREEWLHDNSGDEEQEGVFMLCSTPPVAASTPICPMLIPKSRMDQGAAGHSASIVRRRRQAGSTNELLKHLPLHRSVTLET